MVHARKRLPRPAATPVLALMLFAAMAPCAALALSEPKQEQAAGQDVRPAPQGGEPQAAPAIPLPDALIDASAADKPQGPAVAEIVEHDITKAPEPVRHMRQMIIDAAASSDIEKLRPLLNPGPNQTRVDGDEDPVAALKSFSGDADGLEVLAIIIDLLSAGYARMDAATPDETYVFPYFAGKPLASLTAPEKVELLRIVTAGDLSDMQEYGNYSFYRIGITPDGRWKFFTAGD